MLSLLSDPFFFTGFPLSGIYNIPTEVERLIFTALSYQSYFKLKAQCCFHLEIFLHEPFTAFTSHGMPRPLRFLQFTAKESGWYKEGSTIPPSHSNSSWRTQSLLPMDNKAAGREKERLGGGGGRNQFFMLQKPFSQDTQPGFWQFLQFGWD